MELTVDEIIISGPKPLPWFENDIYGFDLLFILRGPNVYDWLTKNHGFWYELKPNIG